MKFRHCISVFLLTVFGMGCSSNTEKVFNSDGSLQAEYETKNGIRHGTGKFYGNKNYLASTETWIDGKCEGITWVFNANGDTIFKANNHDGKVYGTTWLYATNKKIRTIGDMWEGKMTGWVNSYDTLSGELDYKNLVYNARSYKEVFDVAANTSDFYFDVFIPDTLPAAGSSQIKVRLYNMNENRKAVHFKLTDGEIDLRSNADSTWISLSAKENIIPVIAGPKGYNRLMGVIQVDEMIGDTLLHFKYPVVDVYYAK